MAISHAKHIVIAPLDWGLGHTTRCIPIIHYLREQGHKITVAGNDSQLTFLNETFPGIPSLFLEGYNIRYTKNKAAFSLKILQQVPGILKSIRQENAWLKEQVRKHHFDGIVSDNRYGLYHEKIPSVIVTHQLQIQSGMGVFADSQIRKHHYKYLSHFDQCWVPDMPGKPNLGGVLSHPAVQPSHANYIGLLSQLQPAPTEKKNEHLLILLSGPEPQRSILHELLWKQLAVYPGKVVFIAGTDNYDVPNNIPPHITYYGRVSKLHLQPLIETAGLVICRSGYSSLMDLVALNKIAVLIPTPGQTEQEYLAKHLHKQAIFMHVPQKHFDLQQTLKDADQFSFQTKLPLAGFELFKPVVDNWLLSLARP